MFCHLRQSEYQLTLCVHNVVNCNIHIHFIYYHVLCLLQEKKCETIHK